MRARALIAAAMLGTTAPAAAQGFNITQLLGYGFEVKTAVPVAPGDKPVTDVLYLQGRLPSESQPSVMRCTIRPSAGRDDADCRKVY